MARQEVLLQTKPSNGIEGTAATQGSEPKKCVLTIHHIPHAQYTPVT